MSLSRHCHTCSLYTHTHNILSLSSIHWAEGRCGVCGQVKERERDIKQPASYTCDNAPFSARVWLNGNHVI